MKAYKIVQTLPELSSIGINLNEGGQTVAASRKYMAGSFTPKSCKTKGLTNRLITTGFETQYGEHTRSVKAPANMTVVKIFYRKSAKNNGEEADDWAEFYVVFFNEDKKKYDIMEFPKYNTQNFYVGFEYKYRPEMMRRLKEGATFAKGEVFATSPGLSDTGEWMFGMETLVAGMTLPSTEEDGIVVTRSYLDRMTVMFEHLRDFSWNDTEFIPLNLYGTLEVYKPFPENGDKIRDDGLVMAFRRRDSKTAMASLTRKDLMRVDHNFDVKFYGPPNGIVKSLRVLSERHKNRSNNKNVRQIQEHTEMLSRYESRDNEMMNSIKSWYYGLNNRMAEDKHRSQLTDELAKFVFQGLGNVTIDSMNARPNMTKRTKRNKQLLDWNVEIIIKEDVRGKKRFKLTDVNGGKGVIVDVIEDWEAPIDKYGRRAEVIANNTPAFRRQIFSALMSQLINFINLNVYDEVERFVKEKGDYKSAWKVLHQFYEAGSKDFTKNIIDQALPTAEERNDHIDYVLKNRISIERRSDASDYGVEVVRNLMKAFPHMQPTTVTYYNELGQQVETTSPIMITSVYYMLLDKFGTEQSSEAFPKRNMYGFATKLNSNDKYDKWYRAYGDRNTGETEARIETSQSGGEETTRMLVLSNSPSAVRMAVKRIIRADDPFNIPEIIKPDQYKSNRAVQLCMNYLSDSGWTLRSERPTDMYQGGL